MKGNNSRDGKNIFKRCEISSSHGSEYEVQNCLLGCTAVTFQRCVLPPSSGMMEAARTSETSVDNYFTRHYIPEDNSELHFQEILKDHSGHIQPDINQDITLTKAISTKPPTKAEIIIAIQELNKGKAPGIMSLQKY
jgi:hypothetical protein